MIKNRREFQENLMADYGQMGMMLAHLTQSANFLDQECGRLENNLTAKEREIDKVNAQKLTLESQLQVKQTRINVLEQVLKLGLKGVGFECNGHIFEVSGYDYSGLCLIKKDNITGEDYGFVDYDEFNNEFRISLENFCNISMKKEGY